MSLAFVARNRTSCGIDLDLLSHLFPGTGPGPCPQNRVHFLQEPPGSWLLVLRLDGLSEGCHTFSIWVQRGA